MMNFVGLNSIQKQMMALSYAYEQQDQKPTSPNRNGGGFFFPADRSRRGNQPSVPDLRRWITRISGVQCQTDDASLSKFLVSCNNDQNKAKRRIERFYTVKTSVADWFQKDKQDLTNPNVLSILRSGVCVPCHYDLLGRWIIICRLGSCNPRQGKLDDVVKLIAFVAHHFLESRMQTLADGFVVIMDFKGFGMRDAAQYTPNLLKKIVILIEDSIPCRLKALHLLNAPTFVPTLLKSFVSNKLKRRIHVHGPRLETGLHSFVPPGRLPMEYGGTQGRLQQFIDAIEASYITSRDNALAEDGMAEVFFETNDNSLLL